MEAVFRWLVLKNEWKCLSFTVYLWHLQRNEPSVWRQTASAPGPGYSRWGWCPMSGSLQDKQREIDKRLIKIKEVKGRVSGTPRVSLSKINANSRQHIENLATGLPNAKVCPSPPHLFHWFFALSSLENLRLNRQFGMKKEIYIRKYL